MNTSQIASILANNNITKNYFKGATPSNRIQKYNTYPYALVANTDKSGEKGTHWVAMFVRSPSVIEYFDSFGEEPNDEIFSFLSSFSIIIKNISKLQSIFDTSCGAHVIFFLIQRCSGKSF